MRLFLLIFVLFNLFYCSLPTAEAADQATNCSLEWVDNSPIEPIKPVEPQTIAANRKGIIAGIIALFFIVILSSLYGLGLTLLAGTGGWAYVGAIAAGMWLLTLIGITTIFRLFQLLNNNMKTLIKQSKFFHHYALIFIILAILVIITVSWIRFGLAVSGITFLIILLGLLLLSPPIFTLYRAIKEAKKNS